MCALYLGNKKYTVSNEIAKGIFEEIKNSTPPDTATMREKAKQIERQILEERKKKKLLAKMIPRG